VRGLMSCAERTAAALESDSDATVSTPPRLRRQAQAQDPVDV
jgi:hypothetical protein